MSDRAGRRQPIRVLIVDDHDVVHWGLRIMLERQPWIERSFSAHTGAEAIAQTSQHAVDLRRRTDLSAGHRGVRCEWVRVQGFTRE